VSVGRTVSAVHGAPDDDRGGPLGEQGVDLGVGQLGVAAGGERLGDRDDRDEPVLEPRLLLRARDPRQHLEAGVHLQRVRRDRHGPLAACPQALRDGEGEGGLADPRGAEEGEGRGRHPWKP
jgi:hypothetical protein